MRVLVTGGAGYIGSHAAKALKQAGFFARNAVQQGIGHFWFTGDPLEDPRGASAQVAPRVLRFLQERL